jgi:EAL domain-containing protein (putative c-di-GMP-specific phosphodiesterase class I)
MTSRALSGDSAARGRAERLADRIQTVLDDEDVTMVHQPIVDLDIHRAVGYEALARFSAEPLQPPDRWFADAHSVGRGTELEALAVECALASLPDVPQHCFLAVNVSPRALLTGPLQERLLAVAEPERIMLEITEHAAVDDYHALAAALAPLRLSGMRVAVDDAGAGYASLRHILRLAPDVIKLDGWFAERIERDRAARALAVSLTMFVMETQMTVVAEGIERAGQAAVLHNLGVTIGQGYLFGRPGPLPGD